MNTIARSSRTPLILVALAFLTSAVYWGVSQHDFIRYDDPDYVTMNPHVNQGFTKEALVWAFGRLHGTATYWHPLTWLSHMLDCELFGLRPGPHHVVNVVFHVLNVLLVFWVLRRMTGATLASAAVAALWAVHPLQVDTVAWIAERKNLLSALFWLGTMGAYVRYAASPGWGRFLLVFVLMAVGLMAKPILVTLPCVLLLLDIWPLRRFCLKFVQSLPPASESGPVFSLRTPGWLIVEKLPLLALSIASSAVTLLAHQQLEGIVADESLPLGLRIQSALVSYARYLGHAVLPAGLSVFYPHPGTWPASQVIFSGVLLLAITAAAVLSLRRLPAIAVGWFWFLGVLVPTIGLVQAGSQSIADRFMYLPLLGLLMAVVWGGHALLAALRFHPNVSRGVLFAVILLCAFISSVQVRHWRDTGTLFAQALRVTDHNYIAYAVLGTLLSEDGKSAEALPYLRKAVEIKPDHFECRLVLGHALANLQQFPEAIEQFRQAVKSSSRFAEAHASWGAVLIRMGETEGGLEKLDDALKIAPEHTLARLNRVLALQRLARFDEAATDVHDLLRLRPTNTVPLMAVGNGFINARRLADALAVFESVLVNEPDFVEALNRVAWILSTHQDLRIRNGPEALRLAQRANSLTGQRDPATLNTLAAAYAEAGRFPEAVATAQQALDLATAAGQADLARIIGSLLDLYKAGTPYREQ